MKQQPAAQQSQSTSTPAAATSKPTSSPYSQPAGSRSAGPTSANEGLQGAPSAATSQPQATAPSTLQTPQQSQPAGTGYYGAPQGTAVGNEKPTDRHQNLGRDAAIGAGAGAVGIGGYEAMKHRDPAGQAQSTAPTSNVQRTGAAPTGYDAQKAPDTTANQSLSSTPSTSHPSQQPQSAASRNYSSLIPSTFCPNRGRPRTSIHNRLPAASPYWSIAKGNRAPLWTRRSSWSWSWRCWHWRVRSSQTPPRRIAALTGRSHQPATSASC